MSILNFPKLLTPREAASLLRVSVGTLAVWRCTKRYPLKFLKIGHAIRYSEDDVLAFVASGGLENQR